jgi:hypothetical protein
MIVEFPLETAKGRTSHRRPFRFRRDHSYGYFVFITKTPFHSAGGGVI